MLTEHLFHEDRCSHARSDAVRSFCFDPFAEVINSNENKLASQSGAGEQINRIDNHSVEGVLR